MLKSMRAAAPAGSISVLIASVRTLGERLLALAALEGRQAGLSLVWMLGLALVAAVLVLTGWLALNTARVLLPLLMVLGAATRSAPGPTAGTGTTEE